MLTLPNYQISHQIYESLNSLIFKGLKKKDNQPVILKMLKQDYPTPAELIRYQQEYEIIRDFDFGGVIKVYDIEKYHNTLVIILEDFGGESLKQFLADYSLTIKEFLPLAIQMTDSLGNIHTANIIHKDINPANIVWNKNTNQLKIIDFGIASRLPRENPVLKNPEQLEGTLAYLSPEQTGRMNRVLDYRTDLYSLGVTFYELLTGKVPFESDSAMELVHCHIAKTPKPVSEINPDVPPIISDIVMKLMAKNVEDRYQSAFGVKADLEKVQENLAGLDEENLTGFENLEGFSFELAQNDFSGKLQIPQKLYGRENEINTLLQVFERVSGGTTEMMLVAGYSGVGKTALVNEVHKPMTEKRGYFAAGKFDQFQKNIPYLAITQAFNGFCRYLLMENAETLTHWQTKILEAVGNNGQIIIDVIPDLELVIGKQPAVASVGPTEAQNRFQMFFLNFVTALCDKEHPFILFIDDLQWVDSASLALLKTILLDDEIKYLLIIGAYRDNEVDSSHPFVMAVSELEKANAIINTIELANLLDADVNHLLQESLKCESALTQPLTDLIYNKTQGNAFFTHQFLQTLYFDGLLRFDFDKFNWQWDVESIKAQNITDNVVDLMANKIDKLPEKTSKVLQLAACIGNQFDFSLLAIIDEQDPNETLEILRPAVAEGLIQPLDENYKHLEMAVKAQFMFLHDRVQQAAYALIDDEHKQVVHLQIGRLLLKNTPADALEDNVFAIVGQFNSCLELLHDQDERLKVADLNLMAGQKAKMATAYGAALNYLNFGRSLLTETSWETDYPLTFALYKEYYECAYLNIQFEQAEYLFNLIINQVNNTLDKAEVYSIYIRQLSMQAKYAKVVQTGKEILKELGLELPSDDEVPAKIQEEIREVKNNWGNRDAETILAMPLIDDPVKKAIFTLLVMDLGSPIYFINPNLYFYIMTKTTNIGLKEGNMPGLPYSYTAFGIVSCQLLSDYQQGYDFGMLGIRLSEKLNNFKCVAHNVMGLSINHWTKPATSTLSIARKGITYGLEEGDIQFACFNHFGLLNAMAATGMPLDNLLEEVEKALYFVRKNQNVLSECCFLSIRQFILNLQSKTIDPSSFNEGDYQESQFLEKAKEIEMAMAYFYIYKLYAFYLFEDYEAAQEMAIKAREPSEQISAFLIMADYNFYHSLTLLALYPKATEAEKHQYHLELQTHQNQMKIWSDNCPENFQHKYLLVQAEIARIDGNALEAMDLYDQAIALAKENDFLHNEALSNEQAAKFWLGRNKAEIAQTYLKEAHYRYQQWGALAKVKDLEERYPQWLAKASVTPTKPTSGTSETMMVSSRTNRSNWLDLDSVMKASQTLSGEIVLSKLLANMMQIVIENAGAQKGLLLLPQQEQWFIEAEGQVENEEVTVLQSLALEECSELPINLIHYVARTQENVVLSDATKEGNFTQDAYIVKQRPKSVLGMPLLNQGQLTGLLYLENNLTEGAFTPKRLQVLNLLSSQMAISIENSLLYNNLEQKVVERTKELAQRTDELEQEVVERQRAEEAAKVASQAKTDFLSNMSHELRTPLNGILGYAQILKRGSNLEESQLSGLNTIYQSGNHLLTLINDILDLSKIEARKLELYPDTLHFGSFIESLSGIIRMRAEQKDVYFSYEAVGELPGGIKADEKRLRQVLINLLGNAIKFTDKGQVTLRVSMINEATNNQALIRFEVEDSGVGMTPEQLEKIFLPFEQVGDTKRRAAGTGLGLAISRQLVELMGGEIFVSSEYGQGSCFWFEITLPKVDVKAETQQKTQQIIGYRGERRTILIADDNQQNRDILLSLLKLLDFNVIEARDGQECVAIAEETQPDMIFMDLVMPVMTGFEAVQRLRQIPEFKDTPIIANSASVFEADQEKSLIAGCNTFLPKPIEEDKLSQVLLEHMKLDWIYKEIGVESEDDIQNAQSAPMIAPPPDKLETLYQFATIGNMRRLKEQASQLEAENKKYQPFARKIQELAKGFKGKQILALIEDLQKDSQKE